MQNETRHVSYLISAFSIRLLKPTSQMTGSSSGAGLQYTGVMVVVLLAAGTPLSQSSFPRGFFCQSAIRVGFHNAVNIVTMLESHHYTGDITFVQITFSFFCMGRIDLEGEENLGLIELWVEVFFSFHSVFHISRLGKLSDGCIGNGK